MYDITLQEIEYFLAAAERLSFTETAQALFVSQPVISKIIKRLERELALKLFNRDNRGVTLTGEGELLYNRWRLIFNEFDVSVKAAQAMLNEAQKNLRIGCLSEFEHDLNIQEFIRYFEELYPDISVDVELYGFKDLREQLLNGNCDLMISYNSELDDLKDVRKKTLIHVRHYIAMSNSHRLAARDELMLHQLKNEVFYIVAPSESKKSADRILEAFRGADFSPKHIKYTPNISSLAFAISQGKGVTICHRVIARGYENEIKLFPFCEMFNNIYLAVAWRQDGMTPELQKMVDLI